MKAQADVKQRRERLRETVAFRVLDSEREEAEEMAKRLEISPSEAHRRIWRRGLESIRATA
jgi:hypothetical protein